MWHKMNGLPHQMCSHPPLITDVKYSLTLILFCHQLQPGCQSIVFQDHTCHNRFMWSFKAALQVLSFDHDWQTIPPRSQGWICSSSVPCPLPVLRYACAFPPARPFSVSRQRRPNRVQRPRGGGLHDILTLEAPTMFLCHMWYADLFK